MAFKLLLARLRVVISCKKTTKLRKRRPHSSQKQNTDSSGSEHRLGIIPEEYEALVGERDEKMTDERSACSCSECLLKLCDRNYDDNPVVDLYKSQELEACKDHCFSTKIPLSTLTTEEWTERCQLLKDKIRELETRLMMAKWLVVKQERYGTLTSGAGS